ncbi:MAG: FHA domain-containing protein [Myxococcales bacterium]|nr:FHA domain-containing protein [Myxococcales bacterium]
MEAVSNKGSSVLCLADFAEDSRTLDAKAFAEKHGGAFLLHHGPLQRLEPRSLDGSTLNLETPSTVADVPFNPRHDFLVFPLRRKVDSVDEVIWLGQSESNDVVIPDASVSAIHAFVQVDHMNRYFIQDMNSRNGTKVSGQKVPGHGHGKPVEMTVAADVELGGRRMTFLPASDFLNLVMRLFGGP